MARCSVTALGESPVRHNSTKYGRRIQRGGRIASFRQRRRVQTSCDSAPKWHSSSFAHYIIAAAADSGARGRVRGAALNAHLSYAGGWALRFVRGHDIGPPRRFPGCLAVWDVRRGLCGRTEACASSMRGAPIYFWAWRMGFQPQAEGSRLSQARRLNSRGRVKTRPRG
jgi:hypothetical protein